jgi:N-glycosylase/DNA lyase
MKITSGDKFNAAVIMNRFKEPRTDEEIFYELLFCLCAPQTTFKNNIKVNDHLRLADYYGFTSTASYDIPWLAKVLKPVRFYNNKAQYVAYAKQKFPEILELIRDPFEDSVYPPDFYRRAWLVKSVRGMGMKTASHFLRNLGATDLAIIDRHILKYLEQCNPGCTYYRTGIKKYEELEGLFRTEAIRLRITVAELDIIVWKYYSKTEWSDFTH